MRICSYNIHSAIGGLDRQYNTERVASVIEDINADILGLQEVCNPPGKPSILDILEVKQGYHTLFLRTLTDHRGAYGNALVTRFPIIRHEDIDLESHAVKIAKTPRSEARRAIAAELDIGNGEQLWVIVTHLAVQRSARRLQSEKLIGKIHEILDVEKDPCVLMGDMNEWAHPAEFVKQLDGLFGRHIQRRTFPAAFPLLPLDRIWISSRLKPKSISAWRGKYARTASDHLPIYADVHIEK